ncbi:PD-(D/E)XK nuclease superfamily protein [Marinitoga hydrogenitolerans DSM 16785]|uniref:PD-(D/E)XK nuclease superfamily protein n=1 Tax=Marinitoga hydrogenitolerans (strain DSM 16785 / JCM 12826 / AT1271) TaxID=1122195 RepID=A0A1M5ANB5_MARH1|nr:hypothetical protein [Marinitoga hydrogenitolerans]SHF31665.1 PD-(D/E)XK nuclease superfamily protein [Marinitoga hydrogenitolerans DSM 16785]
MEELGGEVLTEVEIDGGKIDLLIRYEKQKYLIEIKRNPDPKKYENAKKQLLEYLKRIGLKEGWLIIYSNAIKDFEYITEEENGIKLHIWFIKTNLKVHQKLINLIF